MLKKSIIILVILLIALVVKIFYSAGVFKSIEPHSDLTNVSLYTNIAGTEDIDIDREKGLLFISSTDRWNLGSKDDGIYLLNLEDKNDFEHKPEKIETTLKEAFHPHGIHFFQKDGKDYLFAVNHNQNGDFVEVFEYEKNQLTHLKTYENEQMCCPNDVVAIDIDKFYVTNDHGASEGLAKTLEEYLQLSNSYLLYYDGATFKKVLEDVSYANGVNVSNDGKTLYVTEASGGKIYVMDRNIETGELRFRFSKALNTGADNISIDSDGSLWIGAHPKLLSFVEHATNNGKPSPSQVLKLTHQGENDFNVKEIYLDSGEVISASSVALPYKNEVFIGVVFESKLLRGTLNIN